MISPTTLMDLKAFIIEFQDYLAPKLDTYEQAIHLYIFRHTRLLGLTEATFGFKSARSRMACGVGEKGKPMSDHTAYLKLTSLDQKGAIKIVRTEHTGRLIKLNLPSEIPDLIPPPTSPKEVSFEEMDFFNVPENRLLILEREGHKCFYTLRPIDSKIFVLDHIVSRPEENNSYRNIVAASRESNNRKGAMNAEDFLRQLFRGGFLNEVEFEDRLKVLAQIKAGELKPKINPL
jgi:hypothetical protein